MQTAIARRVGIGLICFSLVVIAVTIRRDHSIPWSVNLTADGLSLLAGLSLLPGNPRLTQLVRLLVAFLLSAVVVNGIGQMFLQPPGLTLLELRRAPLPLLEAAGIVIARVVVLLLVVRLLARIPADAAMTQAGFQRLDTATAGRLGIAAGFVAVALAWIELHGRTAALAESLALQQLGPDYEYALTAISSTRVDGHKATEGIVTAWRGDDVKQIVLHWQERN